MVPVNILANGMACICTLLLFVSEQVPAAVSQPLSNTSLEAVTLRLDAFVNELRTLNSSSTFIVPPSTVFLANTSGPLGSANISAIAAYMKSAMSLASANSGQTLLIGNIVKDFKVLTSTDVYLTSQIPSLQHFASIYWRYIMGPSGANWYPTSSVFTPAPVRISADSPIAPVPAPVVATPFPTPLTVVVAPTLPPPPQANVPSTPSVLPAPPASPTANPTSPVPPPPETSPSNTIAVAAGTAVAALVVVVGIGVALWCWRTKTHKGSSHTEALAKMPAPLQQAPIPPQEAKFHTAPQETFKLKELKKATNNFAESTVIGRGSFGVVYRGTLPNGSFVAIKRLREQSGVQARKDLSWRMEVEALRKVRHKNLVPLLGVCVEGGERLLVFEYFAAGSLSSCLHQEGTAVLTWDDRVRIAYEVCRGVIYLHDDIHPPILHRDIKSANVLLRHEEVWKASIADFGLAHLMGEAAGNTSSMVKGTVPYMAPEYLHGGPRFLTPKCDVYSFGVLLLELVSGRPVISQKPNGIVDRLSERAESLVNEGREVQLVDQKLASTCKLQEFNHMVHVAVACLERDPSARPTMEEVGQRLLKLMPAKSSLSSELQVDPVWRSESSMASGESFTSGSGSHSQLESSVMVASRFVTPR